MPIGDIGSHVTTGQEFLAHWADVDADRTAQTLPAFAMADGYQAADLTADVADIQAAITAQEDLQNGLTIAMAARDAARTSLRNRLIEFRKVVQYRMKGSGFDQSLPDTPALETSEQKLLKALDDMASIWTRINAASGIPNFTPPLLLLGGYAVAAFQTEIGALRTKFLAVTNAENDARIGRKKRDLLLEPLRDRLVQYRQGIEIEYGEQHVFTQTLPDVYEASGGGGGPQVPAAPGAPMLTYLGNGQVGVTWSPVAGALSFKIYQQTGDVNQPWVEVGAAMAGPATLTSLPPGATIRVRLTALNANGEGPPGPHAEITLPAPPPN